MIGNLAAATVAKVGAGVIAVLLALLVWCWLGWSSQERQTASERKAKVEALAALELLETDIALRDLSDKRRDADQLGLNEMEQDYAEAIENVVDTAPDAARIALGCERLRRSATPGVSLPAVCGTGG